MNKKLSIIIPVYNGEKTIEKCITSIVNNDYKNIEIIVVNDGSKDRTLEILESIQKKETRLKIISQKNSGVSKARNTGIKNSTGDYIFFVDSDDYIEKSSIKFLMANIENYDILIFGYQAVENEKVLEIRKLKNEIWDGNNICKNVFDNLSYGVYIQALWNKIYRRTLIEDINFNSDYIVSEDTDFNIQCFDKATKIKILDYIGYNYNIVQYRTKYREGIIDSHIKISEELLNYFKDIKDSKRIISKFLYNSLFYDLLAITNSKKLKVKEKFDKYNYIKKQDILSKLDSKEGLTGKKKIMYKIFFKSNVLAYVAIKLYCKLERN